MHQPLLRGHPHLEHCSLLWPGRERGEIAHGLQKLLPEVRDLSRPLTFCCPNSEADPGLEGLEAHTVLEAHCKEKGIKLKI